MNADEILQTLTRNSTTIRSFGARRLGLFGSQARGEASPDSEDRIVLAMDHYEKYVDLGGTDPVAREKVRVWKDFKKQQSGDLTPPPPVASFLIATGRTGAAGVCHAWTGHARLTGQPRRTGRGHLAGQGGDRS